MRSNGQRIFRRFMPTHVSAAILEIPNHWRASIKANASFVMSL
jgi:hypothetical protein